MQPLPSAQLAPPPVAPPRRVFLFTGHMIDAPNRPSPRFPSRLAPRATRALSELLTSLSIGPHDAALAQAANGGDIIFLEACLERGARCQVLLPYDEQTFLRHSVVRDLPDGAAWAGRYQSIKARLSVPMLEAPTHLGTLRDDEDAYERCNEWLLRTAKSLAGGLAELHLVCIWDGAAGGGRGGTEHMMQRAKAEGAMVHWLDTRVWLAEESGGAFSALMIAIVVLSALVYVLRTRP